MADENAVLEKEKIETEETEKTFDFDALEEKLQGQLENELADLQVLTDEKEKIGSPDELGKVIGNVVWEQFLNQIAVTAGEDFIEANRGLTLDLRTEAHVQSVDNFEQQKYATHNTYVDYKARGEEYRSNFYTDPNNKPAAKQKQEQRHQEDLRRLQSFRPIDDTFMRGLFKENLPLAQLVLRIITGKPDLTLTKCETQADLKRVTGARSICLDAYATDSTGKKYDLEVQRSDNGADPHRARYHSSVMDVENLDEKQDYRELPDTYVIFITEKDYYKAGKPVYVIQNMNLTLSQPFDDGAHILYVNGEYRDDSDIGRLMHDFNCTNASDMNFTLLAERTRYLKETSKGVSEMCKVMEELRDASYAEGMEDGKLEQARVMALKLWMKGETIEEIADLVGFSASTVEKWLTPKTA